MDGILPDGTIVKNVPDGITKAELTSKLEANGYDIGKLKETAPVTASGVGAEMGKGLIRGASDVAMGAGSAAGNLLLGPVGGRLATQGMEALAAPSHNS